VRFPGAALVLIAFVASCGDEPSPAPETARSAAPAESPPVDVAAMRRARVHADSPQATEASALAAPKTPAEWIAVLRGENSSDDERAAAVDALVKIGAPAVPLLIDALDDENAYPFALQALGRLGPVALPAAPALLDRIRQHGNGGHEVPVLSNMGPGVIPILAKTVTDESEAVRAGVTNVLTLLAYTAAKNGDADNARALSDLLVVLLRDRNAAVRSMAVCGVTYGWNARPDTASLLIDRLGDEAPAVRGSAAMFLARVPGDASAVVAALVRALDDPFPWVGFDAANSIRQLGDRAGSARLQLLEFAKKHPEWSGTIADVGVETLQAGLKSDDAGVRRIAAAQLAGMGTSAAPAATALLVAVDDADPAVRASALDALGAAGPTAEAMPKVRAALGAADANVRAAAARTLGRVANAPDDVVADLVRGLADPSADVRRECAIALGRLARSPATSIKALVVALNDGDLVVRAAAATAIGAFGASASSAAIDLRRALAQSDPWIRLGAATSLVRVDPPAADAFAALTKLAVDANGDVRWRTVIALGSLASKDGVPILVDRLNDRSAEVRKAAAASLGQLGAIAVEAVTPLEEMAKSRDEEIADAANQALAKIRPPK
jgi:HEAT repeat protein